MELSPRLNKGRRPRYQRQPESLPHRLTSRDIEIIRAIDRYRYLTSEQVAKLFAMSRQAANKRLKLLFHHHFLGKLPAHLSPKLYNSPDVFRIDFNRQAKLILAENGFLPLHQKSYNIKMPKRHHTLHELLTNDILIGFELAVRDDPRLEFEAAHDLLHIISSPDQSEPWKVPAYIADKRITRTAYPDAVFALLDNESGKRQLFLVEADRMTEPIARQEKRLFNASNIKAKILIYFTAWQQGVFKKHFQTPATQILFVTLNKARARNMKEIASEITGNTVPGLFVFMDMEQLQECGFLLEG